MTAHDILKIAGTVAVSQLLIDLLAKRLVFSKEPYQRAVSAFERAKFKRDKLLASASSEDNTKKSTAKSSKSSATASSFSDKNAKKIQRAQDDCAEAAAEVARRHYGPNFFSSLLFVILYRVLSTEYSGKVVGVLPFIPWKLVQRLSLRGLQFDSDKNLVASLLSMSSEIAVDDGVGGAMKRPPVSDPSQACGFLFVYILCTLSIKFMVHNLVAMKAPKGADGGLSTLMDAPKSQRMLKSLGVDTDELREARKLTNT